MSHLITFESHRPLLFAIAYRMLGSVMEAEDMVQEAFLRWQAAVAESIQSPKAYLSAIVTRLCLDQLKSAQSQRETYIGPWLPEPLLTAEAPPALLDKKEMISMAFLVLLEQLSPVERAVFLLREVFEYEYGEISAVIERSEENCRQLYSRAKKHLVANRPRFSPTAQEQTRLVQSFLAVMHTGDVDALTELLAEDVTHWSDGGGKVFAATRPIVGREAVLRLYEGLWRLRPADVRAELAEVNGETAVLFFFGAQLQSVFTFEVGDGRITAVRVVLNPDKLVAIGGSNQ
ncbi:MAG: RNA polymerase sigma-70 factor [Chloroflexi bacterium]|nr:RNA polymerase sigma-70 factor [Chloroflexota bacterium]